jgi:hypothetical protein
LLIETQIGFIFVLYALKQATKTIKLNRIIKTSEFLSGLPPQGYRFLPKVFRDGNIFNFIVDPVFDIFGIDITSQEFRFLFIGLFKEDELRG